MICPKCGNDNPVNVLYCMRCGHELSHEVVQIRSAVREEVIAEENVRIERRLREMLALGVFVVIAAWTVLKYSSRLVQYDYSTFTSAPRVQVERAPTLDLPLVDAPIPTAQPPKPPGGPSDEQIIRELKAQIAD